MILGIDFGTCFSTVAFMIGQEPRTDGIMRDPDKTGLPTEFLYLNGQELFGYDCLDGEGGKHRADVIKYMKRTVRENPASLDSTVTSGGKSFTIREVLTKYLRYLITEARAAAVSANLDNGEIERIAITAPVGIASGQMTSTAYNELLRNVVAEVSGLPHEKIIVYHEPTAAAVSYIFQNSSKIAANGTQSYLIFDLGGGTLDVTVVEYDPDTNEYAFMAKAGDLNIGGRNWDEALMNYVRDELGITGAFTSKEEEAIFERKMIKLKIDLSTLDESMEVFKYNGKNRIAEVTRADFEMVTSHLLDGAMSVMARAINEASKNGVDSIDKIVLVGGASNMPMIRERIMAELPFFDPDNIIYHEPSRAIAKGAAIIAKLDIPPKERGAAAIGTAPEIKRKEISACTYGFDSTNASTNERMIYNLLFKGTQYDKSGRIEATASTSFIALSDDQKVLVWNVYETQAYADDCTDGAWLAFGADERANGMRISVDIPPEYYTKKRSKEYACTPTFVLDRNGILEFIIKDNKGNVVGYVKEQI